MSTLVTDQLNTDSTVLTQNISVERDITIAALRPFLYVHNLPAGTFYFRIYKDSVLIKEYSFTAAEAKAAASHVLPAHSYFWVYLSLPGHCKLDRGDYQLKLETSGYTYSSGAWLGWNKDWHKVDSLTEGVPSDFSEHSYSFKLVEYAAREF